MSQHIDISFVIPVYNRPDEMKELLDSLCQQEDQNFEIVVVEDGSTLPSKDLCDSYLDRLKIKYFYKENTGPGMSRNYGIERAQGNYCIFLDSDCIVPNGYVGIVRTFLENNPVDAFGGPDAAHQDFSVLQKAINYAMTSFWTTGGIRGKNEKLEKFHPRSFNMGITKQVYETTGGFPTIRFAYAKAAGEDLDLSIQILKNGFKTALIPEAFVYHKRRTSLKQFARQVYNFGIARISISLRHPEALKLLHFLPSLFLIGSAVLLLLSFIFDALFLVPFAIFALVILLDSSATNKNFQVGALSILTSFIQLFAYGWGFLKAFVIRKLLKKEMF